MNNDLNCPCDMKSLFFSCDGRLNRQPFNIILGAAFLVFSFVSLFLPLGGQLIVFLAALAITICPVIKRLHDREYSGVWYGFFLLVAILGLILVAAPIRMIGEYAQVALYVNTIHPDSPAMEVWNPAHALAFLIMLGLFTYLAVIGWFLSELCFFRGTEGPNEYGPDPVKCPPSSCGSFS